MSDAPAKIGHNMGPISPPADTDVLADLQARYPEIATEPAEFEKALATYPEKIVDEAAAANLQDLLKKISKQRGRYKADRGTEKKPWDSLTKVVQNFFSKAEDKLDAMLETWKPRHQAYLDMKAEQARRAAEEEIERQRAETERKRQEAEAAEIRRAEAERQEREAEERAAAARRAAEEAEERRIALEAQAKQLKEQQAKLERERRERDAAARGKNGVTLSNLRKLMKSARAIHAVADQASAEDLADLNGLLSAERGVASMMRELVLEVMDEDVRVEVSALQDELKQMRIAAAARFDAKERKRREAEALKAQEMADRVAEARAREREEQEAEIARLKQEREIAATLSAAAKSDLKAAKKDLSEARDQVADAYHEGKEAARDHKALNTEADRDANRADRLQRRIDNSSDADFGRVRGDLGSVGSNTGRWNYAIADETALRAACGPLGEHFTSDALGGAVYRWMSAHRATFVGERAESKDLPGVVFTWDKESRIA